MSDYSDGAAGAAFLVIWFTFIFIFAIAGYVITSFFLMKIFEKAGVQGKWRAWVPIYNYMIFSKLGDLSPWLILIAFGASILLGWVPVIGWVVGILPLVVLLLAAWRVGLKLQKEAGLAHPVLLPQHRVARHPGLRQVALEHRHPAPPRGPATASSPTAPCGTACRFRRRRAATPQPDHPARAGRLRAAGGLPAAAGSRRLRAAACAPDAPTAPPAAHRAAGDPAGRPGRAHHAADEPAGTADHTADAPIGARR